MSDPRPTGSVRISVVEESFPDAGLETAAGARVEILDRRLRLLRRTHARDAIDLAPGRYVVAVTLPDGRRQTQPVEVRTGETSPVELSWTAPRGEAVRARVVSRSGAKALGRPAPGTFDLRFVRVGAEPTVEPLGDPPITRVEGFRTDGGVFDATIAVHAPPGSQTVHFAEVSVGSGGRTTIALPIADVGEAQACRLTVALSVERQEVDVQMLGSEQAVTVAQFMTSGYVMDAAVPAAAEQMLYGKLTHPFGAALGGYALLRLKELQRLHNWPENLASWFPWLPDAHVILGEQLLRAGDATGAFASFQRALDTALPVFTDGFSILSARLHTLARGTTRGDITDEVQEDAGQALQVLSEWTPWVQFDAITTTLERPGDTPVTKAEGWQRFRPPIGRARDELSYWSDPKG